MKCYHVDAFTKEIFKGNPAAVCVMEEWISDALMQNIAIENNLSETAFTVKEADGTYRLRWFTPGGEINLCGHATLATAFVLANYVEPDEDVFVFHTMCSDLTVSQQGDLFYMKFPAYDMKQIEVTDAMTEAIGVRPIAAYMARDLVCVLSEEEQVRNATPRQEKVKALEGLLLHITAAGKQYDCISRSFAPKLAVTEDPVCGSGHCHIIPIWAEKTGKKKLIAYQASKRGGELFCELEGDTVTMAGYACLYSIADLKV